MKTLFLSISYWLVFAANAIAQDCIDRSTGLVPIADLGTGMYEGFRGGKYPNGSNAIPIAHFNTGMAMADQIQPLNKNGEPDLQSGRIGFMILGFSTAAMTGRTFISICGTQPVHPQLSIVIGAQGGRDINSMTELNSGYWATIDSTLNDEQLTASQIQMIWMSSGDIFGYNIPFPEHSEMQVEKYRATLSNLKQLYPNLKIVFISDRPFAGYIGNENGGPKELAEPTGYFNSWAVKWVIEKQVTAVDGFNTTDIPFIDWGPLLWTDGSIGNKNGYKWECDDAGNGGIHPSPKGRMKEAALLYLFFSEHPYTRSLFHPGN